MICRDELIEVGKVLKTHGVNGEMSTLFTADGFEDFVKPGTCLLFDMDGIIVPFFVATCRPRGNESLLITLDGEDTQQQASAFVGKAVNMRTEDIPEMEDDENDEGVYANDLIGYRAIDADGTEIGEITGVDDNTDNVLFVVSREDDSKDVLIPAVAEMIEDIDYGNRNVRFNLPQGLLDI